MRSDSSAYDVIVIGGGASGLMCAAALNMPEPSLKVLVIEKNSKPGRKLLATGNGRCNFTNLKVSSSFYNTDDKDKLQRILDVYSADSVLKLFEGELGVIPAFKEDLAYPITYQSKTINDALVRASSGSEFIYDTEVTSVVKDDINYKVNGTYTAYNVVFACGGVSLPDSGSNGSLYPVIRSFAGNDSFEKLLPSLVPLRTSDKDLKKLSGLRQECTVTLDGHVEKGELLFTDYGVSGICIMQLSGYYNRAITSGRKIDSLYVDLIPSMDEETKKKTVASLLSKFSGNPADALSGLLKRPIAECVVARSDKTPESIAKIIGDFKISLTGSLGFNNAQVTSGGVRLDHLTDSLEIIDSPGVYVCGEAVNVDGLCGGFNLHWAWSSALTVARNITDTLEVL